MDAQLPDDFDPYASEQAAHEEDDGRNDDEQHHDGRGNPKPAQRRPKCPAREPTPELTQFRHETSMLKALFAFFIPPRDEDPETQRRWRIALGFAVFVLSTSVMFSYGIMQPLGFSGFAYADDVKSIKIELMEQRIFDARVRQCTAATQESRQFYAEKVQQLLRRFTETEGQYRLPTCDEVR